jgi:polyisoprenyl-teichoic acid--peptidoglycan teichoic acid transferase
LTIKQKVITSLLAITAFISVFTLGYLGWQIYNQWSIKPLGAAIPTSSYSTTSLPPNGPVTTGPVSLKVYQEATPTQGPLCGGPPVMSILAIGSDTRGTGYTWGLSDVMRVVRIDFVKPSITVLDFPRDLWVKIPYISDNLNGQDHEKLNQAYLYGNPGDGFKYWDDPSAGPGLLALTLNLNFGVKVDHYVAVNMKTFIKMVDAVGGLDVNLDKNYGGGHLQKGDEHINGTEALALARNRTEGVFSRGLNQDIVLCALQKKLTSPNVIPEIPGLVQSFQGSVQTDLSPEIMSQLACLAAKVPRDNITLHTFPENLFTGARIHDPVFEKDVFIWKVDFNILRNYVAQFQAGSWPDSGTPSSSEMSSSFCQ